MKLITSVSELQILQKELCGSIGLVATMGCLHEGHAALVKESIAANKITILSIFVNPTQFNNANDLKNYPKPIDEDLKIARKLGVDIVFMPQPEELYPNKYHFKITATDPLTTYCEGVSRPGHYEGVLSIIMKLLNLIRPKKAYFGEKDFQQYTLIKRMAQSFFIDTEIVLCATIREPSGLALSSRNARLNTEQKERAVFFAKTIQGNLTIEKMKHQLKTHDIQIDYIELHDNRLYAAVIIDDIRLIDTFTIKTT